MPMMVSANLLQANEVSLIVSVYKDIKLLGLILESLERQSVDGFEVVISEDGNDASISECIENHNIGVIHKFGPDVGWTKNAALNRAIVAASGKYLIFIDGDCVPHSHFVENHILLAERGRVVTGRRVDIGPGFADRLTKFQLSIRKLEGVPWVLWNLFDLIRDGARSLEDGIVFKPGGWFAINFLPWVSKVRQILGCNIACWKDDLLCINGFDEDYKSPAVGEDTDLEWRFEHIGVSMKSCRNMAIVYHFRHPLRFAGFAENMAIMQKKKAYGRYFCDQGVIRK